MTRALVLSAALLFAAAPGLFAAEPSWETRFRGADADKDGALGREEFRAAFPKLKPEAFGVLDADKDGRIGAEEWRAFLAPHASSPAPSAPPPPSLPPSLQDGSGLPVLAPPTN